LSKYVPKDELFIDASITYYFYWRDKVAELLQKV